MGTTRNLLSAGLIVFLVGTAVFGLAYERIALSLRLPPLASTSRPADDPPLAEEAPGHASAGPVI